MLELILVRHGETDSNKKGTYLGWTDVELNERGLRQARGARDRLKGTRVDGIYCSPLKRASKTAEIINENFNVALKPSDALKERNFGIWDDLTYNEIISGFPEQHALWVEDHINYCVEGGESTIQAYRRITEFIDQLLCHSQGTFIIVTHMGCVRKIISYLLGMKIEDSWRFSVDNCGISKIIINDEKYAYLTLLNG
ncbi:alpha-ribazole phosphatase [Anaerobacterium chartisolvens]|uniref:Alpha-ribazole phosphatase n=1 Tax=Anaerobacterium chartisolvens TaxID=1297424 RepID=A0A369B7Q6_9FIRM|nr:alpha-ribazole phosphatase [Anaerobacterium chartisolvens]RCX17559.1 alpha-ribazole phosphatase [Anaerobacterium chartisolvens]